MQNLMIDGWKQPTLVVIFVPTPPEQGEDYCPLRDNSTPKILYVSSGRNTEFALDLADKNASTLRPELFVGPVNEIDTHNKPFNFDGSWNKRWNPNSWSSGRGRTKNENLYYKISFESLDQKYYDESLKTLRAIETNLKNSFYSKIVGHMELPTPDPWPTLSGDCNTDQTEARGLFLQPTRGNWFAIGSNGCPFDSDCDFGTTPGNWNISETTLASIARMSPSEATDAWGNRILWDPSVEGDEYKVCAVLTSDDQVKAQIPSKSIVYNLATGTFVHSPYAARIFSSCGYATHEQLYSKVLGEHGDGSKLWPRSADEGFEVFDNNLIITVPGMY